MLVFSFTTSTASNLLMLLLFLRTGCSTVLKAGDRQQWACGQAKAQHLRFCSCDELLGSPRQHSLADLEKNCQLCVKHLLVICFSVSPGTSYVLKSISVLLILSFHLQRSEVGITVGLTPHCPGRLNILVVAVCVVHKIPQGVQLGLGLEA